MDALERSTPVEQTARDRDANDLVAVYVAGYADGLTLMHSDGHDRAIAEPLERIYARYLRYVELEHPNSEARVYVAGFRDAAADNLPHPPNQIEPQNHRVSA